ncbi:MAG TPA: glycosyltransferase family 4 protein [Lentimicrobium sp.]|jgi:glycosyltransferase involved in cell wall biosynthesis|nr:glycosyltransferase family 4 protein [Lentimicrobium sp.]
MKVLMFGWEFPPHITGGLGTACFGMTKGLMKNGVEVLFVVPKAYGDESQEAVRLVNASDVSINISTTEEIEFWKNITYLEVNSSLVPYVGPEAFDNLMESTEKTVTLSEDSIFNARYTFSGKYGANLLEEVARYALVGAQIARESEFDVIHAHDWLTYAAGIAAKQATGKPLVVHMHATEFDRSGENVNQRVYDIERSGMEAADRVITVSNLTRNIVIDRYGINPEKVITVHNAVEPTDQYDFSQAEKHVPEKIVTFLGRVTFQKGPEYFIEAAYKVLQRDPNVRFVMAGTGDLLEKMIRRVAQLRIASRFHFTGFLRGENVDRMFAMSDVYVMPSVSEPFGISPLEAMRSNVPVVISKQSGVAEILQHALKVDFWDIDAMADAIYGLLQYKSLSHMFSKYGAQEVNNLKWENAARYIRSVYEQVV